MAIAGTTFKVVTEFVFNSQRAVDGADKLNDSIKDLSKTTEMAVASVANLGVKYVMAFSGATGGILGVLGNAIKSADKFKSIQVELANTMVQNKMLMNGQVIGFNDALIQSDLILSKIVNKAKSFGLNPDALATQVKFFNNMLAPKGLAGNNLGQSIELARVSMKAAPALGVSEEQSISGIMAGISGQLSKQTQFGTRLFMEAGDVIKSATGIKDLKEFNKAKPAERIKALIAGLDKLAGSANAVEERSKTVASAMQGLYQSLTGIGSVFLDLGRVLQPFVVEVIESITKYINTDGKKIVKQIGIFIKQFLRGPEEMILTLMQLKELSADLGTAGAIAGAGVFLVHFQELMHFFGASKYTAGISNTANAIGNFLTNIPLVGRVFKSIGATVTSIFKLRESTGILGFIKALGGAMLRTAGFIGVLLIPLQGLSRAIARMKIQTFKNATSIIPTVMEHFNSIILSFRRFFAPIEDFIQGWSLLFESLMGGATSMSWITDITGGLAGALDTLSTYFLALWGTIKGIVAGISAMVGTIAGGGISGLMNLDMGTLGKAFSDAMDNEFGKTMDQYMTPTIGANGQQKAIVSNVINQDIKMTNNFKEVLQPDRIAFTIADQLKKESANRRQTSPSLAGKAQMSI
jgi:hypothetical protein